MIIIPVSYTHLLLVVLLSYCFVNFYVFSDCNWKKSLVLSQSQTSRPKESSPPLANPKPGPPAHYFQRGTFASLFHTS